MSAVRKIDLVASLSHYADHLLPIWNMLPEDVKGDKRLGTDAGHTPPRNRICLVASWRDMAPLRGMTQFIYVEHGAGQNYSGDLKSSMWPDYAGPGRYRHQDVVGYICPSSRVARLWEHPHTAAVGSPKMDDWHRSGRLDYGGGLRTVCLGFHWPCKVAPESGTAFWHYFKTLPDIIAGWRAAGWTVGHHIHPKWDGEISQFLAECGSHNVPDWRAALMYSVLAYDNSSLMYETAAIGNHVIALNCPEYRRDVHHGLRFWDAVPGLQIDEPESLLAVDLDLLVSSPSSARLRDEAVAYAYAYTDGNSSHRAVEAIMSWID